MRKIASRLSVVLVAVLLLTQCSSEPLRVTAPARPVLLAIFAHPDDESTVSMVLTKYAAESYPVFLATATDGRLGVSQHAGIPAGDTLAEARVKELNCTTEKLGIHPPIMFGLHDQLKMGEGLPAHMDQLREMRERVTKLFEELRPTAVITWGPSGWTGHPDHRLVSDIVTEVFQSRNWGGRPGQLYYPAIPSSRVPPNNPIPLAPVDDSFLTVRVPVSERDYWKTKAAFLCHASQYTPEQIEQLYQSLRAAQNGIAYFQPAIAGVGPPDSLLPPEKD
jgi:LmbE family N-acetylglucosaminyl deacetylase